MDMEHLSGRFTPDVLKALFPAERADEFFDALYGDVAEGAYDIGVAFQGRKDGRLHFEFQLRQRPGKCLACSLTFGLPEIFARHPIIDIKRLVGEIERLLGEEARCAGWKLGRTQVVSGELHTIALILLLNS